LKYKYILYIEIRIKLYILYTHNISKLEKLSNSSGNVVIAPYINKLLYKGYKNLLIIY